MLIYSETIRTYSEDEKRLSELRDSQDAISAEIEEEQSKQDSNAHAQSEVRSIILSSMNALYKHIDPDGTQVFKDFFSTKTIVTHATKINGKSYFTHVPSLRM